MSTTDGSEGASTAAHVPAAPPPTITTAVGLHGAAVGAFDSAMEEWSKYSERLVHYFVANDIAAVDKKRAIFLTIVGPTTYRTKDVSLSEEAGRVPTLRASRTSDTTL